MSRRTAAAIACGLLGAAAVAAAVFAPQLRLDTNLDWGPSRKLLLATGALALGLGLLLYRGSAARAKVAGIAASLGESLESAFPVLGRPGNRWQASRMGRSLDGLARRLRARWVAALARSALLSRYLGTQDRRASTASWVVFTLVSLSYLWFVTIGTWNQWSGRSAYHDMQAEAFLKGRLWLLEEPSEAILALADPYDPEARAGISYLWDASLYGGRYFLYWGPVPALLLLPIKSLADVTVRDDVLVFAFSVGALYWSTRLLLALRRDYYPRIPGWAMAGAVLTLGWANPALWNLNSPRVYESSIVGGTFFILMGIFAMYGLLTRQEASAGPVALGGLSFSLAVGTRSSQAIAVLAACLIVLLRAYRVSKTTHLRKRHTLPMAFLAPLLLGVALLGIYNHARFGSPLESGHRYQLTSQDLREADPETLSPLNSPPNLYNYLVNPFRLLPVFPYIKARWGGFRMSTLRLPVPPSYYSEQVTGLLLAAPFAFFALASAKQLRQLPGHPVTRQEPVRGIQPDSDGMAWVTAILTGVFLAEFAVVVFYVLATMRYMGDFMMVLLLLASIGLWTQLAARTSTGRTHLALDLMALGVMAWTCIAGLLLGVTSYHARFENLNPDLFRWLTEFFTP